MRSFKPGQVIHVLMFEQPFFEYETIQIQKITDTTVYFKYNNVYREAPISLINTKGAFCLLYFKKVAIKDHPDFYDAIKEKMKG